jgi:hypothetical protein
MLNLLLLACFLFHFLLPMGFFINPSANQPIELSEAPFHFEDLNDFLCEIQGLFTFLYFEFLFNLIFRPIFQLFLSKIPYL